ncbi:MAG: hypothetical protein V3W06_09110 [Acidimicrobiia bacterium]
MSRTVQQFEQRQRASMLETLVEAEATELRALADTPPEPFPGSEPAAEDEEPKVEGPTFPTEVDCPLEPTAGFVVVVRERRPEVSPGGILLPPERAMEQAVADQAAILEEMKKPPLPAICVAVGDEIDNVAIPCKRGDRVLTAGPCYSEFAGEWFDFEIMAFSAITAVVPVHEES